MCCQTCPLLKSCINTKPPAAIEVPSCYIPNEPNIPIKPWFPVHPYTPTSIPGQLIEPIYPYPNYYTTSTPVIPYYWGRIIPVSEELPVIIQN